MSATITLSVPNSLHQHIATYHAKDARSLVRSLADIVAAYAARRGVSNRVIEYRVVVL